MTNSQSVTELCSDATVATSWCFGSSGGGWGNLNVAENGVQLLGDADEGSASAELLQLARAHIGTGGADAPQNVTDRHFHGALVDHLHCLALRGPSKGGAEMTFS